MNNKTQKLLERSNLLKSAERSISCDERVFSDEAEARRMFSKYKAKLLNVKEWNEHSSLSSFELYEENGQRVSANTLLEGAFYRIYLKGSGKYDWVKIIDIYEAADEMVITVKPTFDPTAEKPDESTTSHFFTKESTNNFCLLRREKSISFYVIGLDEEENTTETKNVLETIRNFAAANIGSYLGIQEGEWNIFCKNFLHSED